MSSNLPARSLPTVEWLEARINVWNDNSVAIGLTSASVITLATDLINARGSFTTTQVVRAESKADTAEFHNKAMLLHDKAAGMIHSIKAFADASADPGSVYALAQVSPPDPATPAGPPVTPTNVRATLRTGGSVVVQWDGSLAQRTFFEVLRIVDAATEYSRIASIGEKEFVDTTVPQGTVSVQYAIRAVRGNDVSPTAGPAVVQIGATPIDEDGTMSLAA